MTVLDREELMEKVFVFLTKDFYWLEENDDDLVIHKVRIDDDAKGMRRKIKI